MKTSIREYLNQFLPDRIGVEISSFQSRAVGGGSINESYQLTINHNIKLFLKINLSEKFPGLFDQERNGLEFLARQKVLRVPDVIACDEIDKHQIIVLEWIESGLRTETFWREFGRQLAQLHRVTGICFGLAQDNYMGALPQFNEQKKNWSNFFAHCRLEPQLRLAQENSLIGLKHLVAFEKLHSRFDDIFDDSAPSLLHGDLWSGNFMCDQLSEPVLIDPAIYFGHRSVDLAMTTLFGGFDRLFYESYNYHFPFPENYHEQWEICNLYPLLIHLNLFGIGYLPQIENTLKKFS